MLKSGSLKIKKNIQNSYLAHTTFPRTKIKNLNDRQRRSPNKSKKLRFNTLSGFFHVILHDAVAQDRMLHKNIRWHTLFSFFHSLSILCNNCNRHSSLIQNMFCPCPLLRRASFLFCLSL